MKIYTTDWRKTKVKTYDLNLDREKAIALRQEEIEKIKNDEIILWVSSFINSNRFEKYLYEHNGNVLGTNCSREHNIAYVKEEYKQDIVSSYINGNYRIKNFEEFKKNGNAKKSLYAIQPLEFYDIRIQVTKILYILELINNEAISYNGINDKNQAFQYKQFLLTYLKELNKALSVCTITKSDEMSFEDASRFFSPVFYEISCEDYMYMTPLTKKILEFKNISE